ncbi:MAG: chemotaxis protein CheC [Burkholderiales bacterium]|nr:chemotaxis protein CheC [Burkholderiales bacterium]
MKLNDLAMDALTEMFNLGVGQAAHAFSQIAGDSVLLTVPNVLLLPRAQPLQRLGADSRSAISSVRQQYSGAISAEAVLMFPAERGLELVRMMVGGDLPLDQLAEMEQEALCEIGNILLNSVMASLADAFKITLDGSLPSVELSQVGDVLNLSDQPDMLVLLIDIQFEVAAREVKGMLAFLLDVPSQDMLERLLAHFLDGV